MSRPTCLAALGCAALALIMSGHSGAASPDQPAEVRGLLAAALRDAGAVQDEEARDWLLSDIGQQQVAAGDLAGALSTARGIHNEEARHYVVRGVARARVKAGDFAGALRADTGVPYVVQEIALAQLRTGDLAGARRTAASLPQGSEERFDVVGRVAAAYARAGDGAAARAALRDTLRFVRALEFTNDRDRGLSSLATAQAAGGDPVGALRAAAGIGSAMTRRTTLRDIALAQARAGDLAGALKTVRGARDPEATASVLSAIGQVQARTGKRGQVAATVHRLARLEAKLPRTYQPVDPLGAVAEAQADAGDSAGALQTIKLIEAPQHRVRALLEVAARHAAHRRAERAREAREAALRAALAVPASGEESGAFVQGEARASSLRDVAVAFSRAGDARTAARVFVQAADAAERIPDENERSQALAQVVEEQAKAGYCAGAAAMVPRIPTAHGRVGGHLQAADRFAKAGQSDAARRSLALALEGIGRVDARKMGQSVEQFTEGALQTAATVYARIGDIATARATAERIPNGVTKDSALGEIATTRAKQGHVPEALSMSAAIADAQRRGSAYEDIAETEVRTARGARQTMEWAGKLAAGDRAYATLGMAKGLIRLKPSPRRRT